MVDEISKAVDVADIMCSDVVEYCTECFEISVDVRDNGFHKRYRLMGEKEMQSLHQAYRIAQGRPTQKTGLAFRFQIVLAGQSRAGNGTPRAGFGSFNFVR